MAEDINLRISSQFDSGGFDELISSTENIRRTIENSFKQFKLPDPTPQIKNFINKFNEQWKLANPINTIRDSFKQFKLQDPSKELNKIAVLEQQNIANLAKDKEDTERMLGEARIKISKKVQKIQNDAINKQKQSINNLFGSLNKLKFSLLGVGFTFMQIGQLAKGLFQPMDNFIGISYDMARQVGGTLYESMLSVTALFNEFAMTLLDAAAPAIEWCIGKFIELFAWFETLSPEVKNLIGWIVGLAVVFAPLIGIIGFLSMGFVNIITLFKEVWGIITIVSNSFKTLGPLLKFLTSGPIGWIILAIAAVVVILIYLWHTSETFRNVVKAVWTFISDFISTHIENIIIYFKNLITFINNIFKIVWWGIVEVVKAVFAVLGLDFDAFSAAITTLWTTLWDGVKITLTRAWDFITSTIKNSYNWIIGVLNSIMETYNKVAEKAGGTSLELFKTIPTTSAPQVATSPSSETQSSRGRPLPPGGGGATTNNYYYSVTDDVSKQSVMGVSG